MLVVISGGSQGLGAAIAAEYVKQGASVVIVARTESKLKAKVAELEELRPEDNQDEDRSKIIKDEIESTIAENDEQLLSKGGAQESDAVSTFSTGEGVLAAPKQVIRYIAADVSNPADCRRVFGEVGSIPDAVFCCAGAANPGFFLETSSEDLSRSLRTVYETALHFSHAALQVLSNAPDKLHKRRTLVYCSSTVAVFPFIGYSSYAPGKAAIRALCDIVRQESLAHNIRVAHILPGSMDSEGFAVEELTKPSITKQIEGTGAILKPDVVAKQVLRDLNNGNDTIFTDTVTLLLSSSMLGTSPRAGFGIIQLIAGVLLAFFGPIVAWVINNDIRTYNKQQVEVSAPLDPSETVSDITVEDPSEANSTSR